MSANRYPFLFATLGDLANQLPAEIAEPLETTLAANPAANSSTLLDCLQRIRYSEGADGQPLVRKGRAPGQCVALSRIQRANAGLTFLLELFHATERVRVEGDISQHLGDDARDGLLLACRGLSEYVDTQVDAA